MNLTPGQVREALQLTQDTYRHWKTVLFPLAIRKGRRACFTPGDLLALAIVKSLTDKIGVPIGNLDLVARALFEACGQQSWAKFERLTVLIFAETWTLRFVSETHALQVDRLAISVPCGPIIAALRAALMIDQAEEIQTTLRFPLAAIAAERGERKS